MQHPTRLNHWYECRNSVFDADEWERLPMLVLEHGHPLIHQPAYAGLFSDVARLYSIPPGSVSRQRTALMEMWVDGELVEETPLSVYNRVRNAEKGIVIRLRSEDGEVWDREVPWALLSEDLPFDSIEDQEFLLMLAPGDHQMSDIGDWLSRHYFKASDDPDADSPERQQKLFDQEVEDFLSFHFLGGEAAATGWIGRQLGDAQQQPWYKLLDGGIGIRMTRSDETFRPKLEITFGNGD